MGRKKVAPEIRRAKANAAARAYYARNTERCRERARCWKERTGYKSPNKVYIPKPPRERLTADEYQRRRIESSKRWRAKCLADKPDVVKAAAKAYRDRNRDKINAIKRESEAARSMRTPPWCDREACRAFYRIAARAERCTGIRFHVDHVLPLLGREVSGLHVPDNLRVMPARANIRKKNRMEA